MTTWSRKPGLGGGGGGCTWWSDNAGDGSAVVSMMAMTAMMVRL